MKKFTAFIFAVLLCVSLCATAVNAYICTPADDETIEKKMTSKKTTASNGVVIEYDVYRSPSFDPKDDTKESTVILCFAENGKSSSELAALLVSDAADKQYTKYNYTVVTVKAPADQKWVNIDEEHGSYDILNTEISPAMAAMPEVVLDIKSVGFPARKIIVAGIGSGGTAAWDYALRNAATVSHIVTVGACVNTSLFAGLISNNIKSLAYVGNADTKRAQAHKLMENNANGEGYSSLTVEAVPSDYNGCIEYVLKQDDEPSVTDWIIEHSYQTRFFTVSASLHGAGDITPNQQAYYGSSKTFYVNVKKGHEVTKLVIDGKSAALTELKKENAINNDELRYSYTFTNITSQRSISVTVKKIETAFMTGNSLLIVSLSLCLVCAATAVIVFFVTKPSDKNEKGTKAKEAKR